MHSQDLLEHVRSVFVRLTRYPDEVVSADADLEQDLGIDSVKRGEILATLRTEFGLSNALKATPDELRTVARVADFLARSFSPGGTDAPARTNGRAVNHGPAPIDARPAPIVVAAPPVEVARGALHAAVEAIAAVTRHPLDLLVPGARLEDDLGIDRRRRDEIGALLRRGGVLTDALAPGFDAASTVGDVTRLLAAANVAAAPPPEAPAARSAATAPSSALAGKAVLVTGSSRGLGRAIAVALGRAGARVVVNSFHSRDEGDAVVDAIRGAGGNAAHVWGSVANPAHVEAMFETIARDVGELHGFISNASNGRFGPLEQTTPEHWELAFRTNVVGYHQCALRAARLMERHGGGRIVALSCNGSARYLEHFGAMGAVKAAVEALTRALAIELAPRNVQVNSIAAGPIYGHVTSQYPDHDRLLPYWESRTPGGRLCTEDDVAAAVLLLLADGARRINGATLTVDGGGSLSI